MSKPLSAKAGPYTPSRGHFAGQTFASYRQYQNANAKAKGFSSASTRLASPKKVQPSKAAVQTKARATRALLALRRIPELTLAQAAKKAGTTPAAVRRYADGNLERQGRRVGVKANDSLTARMSIISSNGSIERAVKGSKQRSLIGEHSAAVSNALAVPSRATLRELRSYRGRSVKLADGTRVELLWDPEDLTRLARLGRLHHGSPYDVGPIAYDDFDEAA